jgi:hypothetical protein
MLSISEIFPDTFSEIVSGFLVLFLRVFFIDIRALLDAQ